MVDLDPIQLQTVRNILRSHASDCRAYAFGSRVRGTAKKFSDLDLLIRGDSPLNLDQLGDLRWAFSDSELPIKVDVVDWAGISSSFRSQIEPELEVIFP